MLSYLNKKMVMVDPRKALPGRAQPIATATQHYVFKTPLAFTLTPKHTSLMVGMGCFWGVERLFWQMEGVYSTAAGYAGGRTPNPTYEETCTGRTGHTEVVLVVFDPAIVSLSQILKTFWEEHDPTQGYRQGNDQGTQYRSAIFASDDAQLAQAQESATAYGAALAAAGRGAITTEIAQDVEFYYAEEFHQQYLHKVPNGYCGLKGTGVACIG